MSRSEPFRLLRRTISALPVVGPTARKLYRAIIPRQPELRFESSPQYWEDRYALGGSSGAGSYGRLALFKADTLNNFVAQRGVQTVIEFGSGDGAQLALAKYPHYTGIDVSARAVEICSGKFARDQTKQFFQASSSEAAEIRADLALSLDVIYHLVEDPIYDAYMTRLVSAARQYVGIYSSDVEKLAPESHIRHRCFSNWMSSRAPTWTLIERIPNPFPHDPERPNDTSWADFSFFARK
jgi:hypothetical protein